MSVQTLSALWPSILEHIRSRVSKQQFVTWFQNLQAQSQTPEELVIRVPNRFFQEWLTQNYLPVIEAAIHEVTGSGPAISFAIDKKVRLQDHGESDEPLLEVAPIGRPGLLRRSVGLHLNEQYTFETFVVGPSNQLAHAAAVAVANSPGSTYNPLFVHGSVGLGKSHLLQAICHAALDADGRTRVGYMSCETFVNEFISAIQRNQMPTFRERYRLLDILMIDDVQFLSRAERSQEEFFHTFNDLYNAQKQIVLSSDLPPHEINGLQERLTSRFKSGLVARIDPPSYEMRVAVLKRKAELRNVAVPDDVIKYIAEMITSNIRELDGGITKVVGYASLLDQPINLEVARTAMDEPPEAHRPIALDDIIRVVTGAFAVRLADLQSKKRTRSIVLPRQICMYLARALTILSLEEIGGYFGGRDHSTVLHAEEKIRSDMENDSALAATIGNLLQKLGVPLAGSSSGARG